MDDAELPAGEGYGGAVPLTQRFAWLRRVAHEARSVELARAVAQ